MKTNPAYIRAMERGMWAHDQGIMYEANPHPPGPLYSYWHLGWLRRYYKKAQD